MLTINMKSNLARCDFHIHHPKTFIRSIILLTLTLQIGLCMSKEEPQSRLECNDPLESEYGKLLHSSVIFRHGDRTPASTYPLDPYKNHSWPVPLGQLLDKGMVRLYNLGKQFRRRYGCFVPGDYDYKSVFVQSSDKDRTIVSAQCFIYGFYGDSSTKRWNGNDTKWVPVPIHTTPEKDDNMILFIKTYSCPAFKSLTKTLEDDEEYNRLFNNNKEMLHKVQKNTGFDLSKWNKFYTIYMLDTTIADCVKIQSENNLTLPAENDMPPYSEMVQFLTSAYKRYLSKFNDQMAKLLLTPIFKSIASDMRSKTDPTLPKRFDQKLHVYSGHDITIDYMSHFFNEYRPFSPYGSNLIFELRELLNGTKVVTVSKMNTTDNTGWTLLRNPDCGYACSLNDFLSWINKITVPDWSKACEANVEIKDHSATSNALNITNPPLIYLINLAIVVMTLTKFL